MCDGLTPGCGGQGAYGPAAGVQGCRCCGAGCGDWEGEYFHCTFTIHSYFTTSSSFSMSKKLRHDRHTVSLLTDHLVFSPKYRGKVLVGDVGMVAEAIIRKTCKELDIEIIDMAVNPDHVHIFLKYPPKYSVSYISKMIKGRSSRVLRKEFPHLKEWCGDHLWAPSCYHGSVGNGWDVVEKYISAHNTYEHNRR